MLRINALKLPLDHQPEELSAAVCARLKIQPDQLLSQRVVKQSVDARRRSNIQLTYSLDVELEAGLEHVLERDGLGE